MRFVVDSYADSPCMIIAAEVTLCPTFTTFDSRIGLGPFTQRIGKKGVLMLEKSNFRPNGLFLVLETQPTNESCVNDSDKYNASDPWGVFPLKEFIYSPDEYNKIVNISFQRVTIDSWDYGIILISGLVLPICVTVILLFFIFILYKLQS